MTKTGKKEGTITFRNVCKEGRVSAGKVGQIRKGLVSGSNVQQIRNQIVPSKKPK